jgi:hypothetical protein
MRRFCDLPVENPTGSAVFNRKIAKSPNQSMLDPTIAGQAIGAVTWSGQASRRSACLY